jgi:signal transduction histidine kinase/ActR/RegA family two-component response regulator
MIFALNKIGSIYTVIGDYPRAIQYMSRSLSMREGSDNVLFQVNTLVTLAQTCFEIKDFSKAKEYAERAIKVARKSNYKQGELEALLVIANTFSQEGKYDESLAYCEEIISTDIKVAGFFILNNAYTLSGWAYNKKGDYDNAIKFYRKAQKLSKSIGNQTGLSRIAIGLGQVYKNKKDGKNAIKWCEEALSLEEGKTNLTQESEAYKCLYETHKMLNNGNQALAYHERYIVLRDSMEKDEASKKLQQAEFTNQLLSDSLNYVKKELKMEMAFQAELFEKDKTRNILIGLGLMALLLAGGFWSRNRYVRKTNAELNIAKNRAERSEQFKQQFLANMSHEIRTPMHAISGMVKILKRNEHLPTQNTFLDAMHTSSDNLVVILNDILDLSKIEAGKLDIESIPLQPVSAMENVTQILKYKAEEKGLALTYQVAENVPALVMGDPTRLNQILLNLTGNAIKFTEKGSVEISLKKVDDWLRFSIKDSGIGIPKDKLESIFGAFEQAKGSTARHYGGTGLGLSISKQLTELQNGKIWIESEEGTGSVFYLELPIIAAAADAAGQDHITEDRLKMMAESLKGIRILLAEDNDFNQMIAQDDLSFFIKNVKIEVVENGMQAVEKFQQGNYDLILMDVQMPEMTGFEATRKIREIEKSEGLETAIPIIAMTASLLKSEVDNCYIAGMDNYIPKPYQPEELIAPIYTVMSKV